LAICSLRSPILANYHLPLNGALYVSMIKSILKVLLFVSFASLASEEMPVWVFPVLDSEHIGNNCSEEANNVIFELRLSNDGAIEGITFVKKSSIVEINKQAKEKVMALSPFEEFENMSASEVVKYSKVKMTYSVPCKHI
jgi:hypothetical protein